MLKKLFSKKTVPKPKPKQDAPLPDSLPPDAFQIAMQSHQTGDFSQAETLYRQILQHDPNHVDALHFLGVLNYQAGQYEVAVELISKAINIYPASSPMYCNLGLALQAQGKLEAAAENYRKAFLLKPDYAEAYVNLGNVRLAQDKSDEAVSYYGTALSFQPDYIDAYYNLGNALLAQNKIAAAIENYRQILFLKPDYAAQLQTNLEHLLKGQGKTTEAIENHQQQLLVMPEDAAGYYQQGILCYQQKNVEAAIYNYQHAILLDPNYAEAYYKLAVTLTDQGKLDAAIENFQQAISLKPDYADAYNGLGVVLQNQGKINAAIENYRHAISIKPDDAMLHDNLGVALQMQDYLDAALKSYQQALLINPNYAAAYCSLGGLFESQGKLNQAVESYKKALEIKPDYIEVQFNLGLLLLSLGQAEGWQYCEARYNRSVKNHKNIIAPNFSFPQWQGESIVGKSLLIWTEQGFGDEIQFCRYVSILKSHGAKHITWVCKKPLKDLLETLESIDSVFAQENIASIVDHDYWTFALSLPLHCKTNFDNIPATIPYLYPKPELVNAIAENLKSIPEFKVGICWKGNPKFQADAKRSPGIAFFKPLFGLSGVKFFTLQPDTRTEFTNLAGKAGVDIGREIDETTFEDAAALIMNLDLVISSCTSICHLAGALGKPVWVVLPFHPDWRWLLNREDSPWYPNTRLFRQSERGNWSEVFQRVENKLKAVIAEESQIIWSVP